MNKDQLNAILQEWAGLKFYDPCIVFDDEDNSYDAFDFTDSLDACFERLVPKLSSYKLDSTNPKFHHAYLGKNYSAWAETPALALCLAIKKMIDGGLSESGRTY